MKHLAPWSAVALLLIPLTAYAGVVDIINGLGAAAGLPASVGGAYFDGGFPGIADFLAYQVITILDVVAVFFLVWAGLKLIISDDEDKLNKAKRTIGATVVGVMLAHLSIKFVEIFVGINPGVEGGILEPGTAAGGVYVELIGIINWVLSLVAVLGILMIVMSGLRAVGSFGKEEGLKNLKETVIGTATGIFFIIISSVVRVTFGLDVDAATVSEPNDPNPTAAIAQGVAIADKIIDYLALIAVAVVIYAGFQMIVNFGNEEQFSKGRSLIFRALVGLAIILISGTLTHFVLGLFVS